MTLPFSPRHAASFAASAARKLAAAAALFALSCSPISAQSYAPSKENLEARKRFADARLGIFLHWGIYSMFGQGEWYMQNAGIPHEEYCKAARGFFPAHFDAKAWIAAFQDAGAGYVTFTTRHHDGFSMWDSKVSAYNVVDATPFGRDILKELAAACHDADMPLHLYYSHIDWSRDDYPLGSTGRNCGKDASKADFGSYFDFMNRQLTELLTGYGPIGAIWFDGWWDHRDDATAFDWRLPEQYALIHGLQPACLIGNNHHQLPYEGEDIQIFERDLPGENKAGFSAGQGIGQLPLETCETMNGMWGYKATDRNYKSVDQLVRLLVSASGKGANLLLNIGPQPSGELPEAALERLRGLGEWMRLYGATIRCTEGGPIAPTDSVCATQRADSVFLHFLANQEGSVSLPLSLKVKSASVFATGERLDFKQRNGVLELTLPAHAAVPDFIVCLRTRK